MWRKLSCSHLVSPCLSQMDGAATDPTPDYAHVDDYPNVSRTPMCVTDYPDADYPLRTPTDPLTAANAHLAVVLPVTATREHR